MGSGGRLDDEKEKILQGLRAKAGRFHAELAAGWSDVSAVGGDLRAAAERIAAERKTPASIQEAYGQHERATAELLLEPWRRYNEMRPIRRCLEARGEFDRNLVEACREAGWKPAWAQQAIRRRQVLDSTFYEILTSACLAFREPWRQLRSPQGFQFGEWVEQHAARERDAAAVLDELKRWSDGLAESFQAPKARRFRGDKDFSEALWRQQRAVRVELEVECAICHLGRTWLRNASQIAEYLRREREELRARAAQTRDWLDSGAAEGAPGASSLLSLSSLDERITEFARALHDATLRRLPEMAEFVTPGPRPRWRTSRPRQAFLNAEMDHGPELLRAVFEKYWERSASLLHDIERAREVAEYWRSAAQKEGRESANVWQEALRNASATLAEDLEGEDASARIDERTLEVFRDWSEDAWLALEAGQIEWWKFLTQTRGRRLAGTAFRMGRHELREQSLRVRTVVKDFWSKLLQTTGWKEAQRKAVAPVERRLTLRDTFRLPTSSAELPGIYRSLFRLTALEDSRLLIGREDEMKGLAQALEDWQSGRFSACLVVGTRGSGKTSLLNCAQAEVFRGCEVVRGEFSQRVTTSTALEEYLRCLLGLNAGADLAAAFAQRRRVIMLEELERTFLRTVGGFEASRALARWVQRTAGTTFWVAAANDRGYQLMDVAVGLGRVFSHRINAMSVTRANLEQAILVRHRLSGLRLRFAMPPAGDPRVSRMREVLGWEDPPQTLYFDSLYEQSAGVFRSAFELWQNSVERAEGEFVDIRHPLAPAFEPLRRDLHQPDHFTLLAVQQHGSMMADELAAVLRETPHESALRLERLQAMGLLEPDPLDAGLRVRPEAQVFVNDLLRRVNLA